MSHDHLFPEPDTWLFAPEFRSREYVAGLVLGVVFVLVFGLFVGCIYKPDAVVKLEIGGKPSAISRQPSAGKDNRSTTRPATGTAASSQGVPHPTGATDTGAGEADPVGLEWSEADRRAIEAGLQAIGGAR